MDLIKFDETAADDAKIKSALFKLVEKLRIKMRKKDKKLRKKDQELQRKDEELKVKDKKLAKKKRKMKVCTISFLFAKLYMNIDFAHSEIVNRFGE
jgi:hypothetical protein